MSLYLSVAEMLIVYPEMKMTLNNILKRKGRRVSNHFVLLMCSKWLVLVLSVVLV